MYYMLREFYSFADVMKNLSNKMIINKQGATSGTPF